MAKTSTDKFNEPREPDTTLESALAYYAAHEDYHLLEGAIRPDKNDKNNLLVVVSSTEFYSVPKTEILLQELVKTELPQRIWVTRGATVWHCQRGPIGVVHTR